MNRNIKSSVFFEEKISNINKLKSCAFFWEQICVYPSFIEDFSMISPESQIYSDLKYLIEEKVIKFAVENKNELKSTLFDSTCCRMDEGLREYMYKHSSEFIVKTTAPPNLSEIIKDASLREYEDDNLKKMLDDSFYNLIRNDILDNLDPSLEAGLNNSNKNIQNIALKTIKEVVDLEYLQCQERGEKTIHEKYDFEGKNEGLILKNSVSSSIFTNEYLYSYYKYKLNNFRSHDANLYIEGLNATIPLMEKEKIDHFSMEDILEIRKMRKWKKAMNRLGEICSTAKSQPDTEEFVKEIKSEVMSEVFYVIHENRKSKPNLVKDCTKSLIWTGISFFPVVGAACSAIGSLGDAVVSYIYNERKQKALPVFIDNIRNINK